MSVEAREERVEVRLPVTWSTAIALAWWWLLFTWRTFATIAVNLWRVIKALANIAHIIVTASATPRRTLLDDFLERRRP
jgi:hypothetical protein